MRLTLIALSLALGSILVGCSSGGGGTGGTIEGVTWALTSYAEGSNLKSVPAGVAVDARFADGKVVGSGGCNAYNADATVSGSKLTIGVIASTKMACPAPQAEVEAAYFASLEKSASYTATSTALTIYDSSGKKILEYAVGSSPSAAPSAATAAPTARPTAAPTPAPTVRPTAAPTAAPTARPTAAPTARPTAPPTAAPTAPPSAMIGVEWHALSYPNAQGVSTPIIAGSDATLTLGSDGIAIGNATCNTFSGPYKFNASGTGLEIGPLASTQKACSSAELSAQDSAFLAAIQGLFGYKVQAGQLELQTVSGLVTLFETR